MATDFEMLRRYAQDGSEDAFAELARRHVDLVYSAAFRETSGDASMAEDVTQAVFVELARKASNLCRHPALAGWLYTCGRRMAANVRRSKERRQRREVTTHTMNELLSPDSSGSDWQQVRPVLDDAMHELNETDRAAVVLRFFKDESLREVGLALRLTENAARMRVDRALEKLRALLAKRGITSTLSGLSAAITAGAVMTAPTGLAATVTAAALAGTATTTSTAFTLFKIMSMTKLKVGMVSALVLTAVAVPVWQEARLKHVTAENGKLRAQSAELSALRQEVERLSQIGVDRAELERLRSSHTRLQGELAKLQNSASSAAEAERLKAELKRQKGNLDSTDTNRFAGAMQDMMKTLNEQKVANQMARMKAKVNLTADQEHAIRDILLQQTERSSEAIQKMLSGKVAKEDVAKLNQSAGNPEDQIKVLLSPEQQIAYQQFNQEQGAANARLAANAELLQVQDTLGLNQEQQDKVFAILYEQTLSQFGGNAANAIPQDGSLATALEQALAKKLKALEPVLTPEQLETYRQLQEKQIKALKILAH